MISPSAPREHPSAGMVTSCVTNYRLIRPRAPRAPRLRTPYICKRVGQSPLPTPSTPLPFSSVACRCYSLFRGMGIRHLPVVNDDHQVIGIITRKELMTDFSQDLY